MSEAQYLGTLHATSVALDGRAVLIRGRSGTGKSALALQLMALGATLVADDRTQVTQKGGVLLVSAPNTIRGLIEARGVGLLRAETVVEAEAVLVVDMDQFETERLPKERSVTLFDHYHLRCIHKIEEAHFPAAILQYLRSKMLRGKDDD